MPLAGIGALAGGIGSGLSSAGGKKASNRMNELAQQELGLQKQQFGLGNAALGGASDYWNALLRGGQAAVQATGPIASQLGQAQAGAANAIRATGPRGGEQNLALAMGQNALSGNIARLYAGMQPLAAQGLTGIGSAYLGSAGQPSPFAAQMGYGQQLGAAQQGASGFGSLLYNSLNKLRGAGGGKQSGGGVGLAEV